MSTALFDKIIFGPVNSRRFGTSLGVNLIPVNRKICSFNCIYCECGWTDSEYLEKEIIVDKDTIGNLLEEKLKYMGKEGKLPDAITFSGNGEPTLHPQFLDIIKKTVELRDRYAPKAKITVLSNSTMLNKPHVVEALKLVDNNVLKLDAGNDKMLKMINSPHLKITVDEIVSMLKQFRGNLTVQAIFLRGTLNGTHIDNTLPEEVESWLEKIKEINPNLVMIYPIQRDTPAKDLQIVSKSDLENIADKVRALGIKAEVF